MSRIFGYLLVAAFLLAGTRSMNAFSLLGPFEEWQTPALGYNTFNSDIGAPKNLGEEYRWNVPTITYGFDNSFLNYFGSNGVAAIDSAFAILNDVFEGGVSSISPDLSEFPLIDPETGAVTSFWDSRRNNLRAQANNIIDLKSVALGLVVEELGLANPIRWTWALRDRRVTTVPNTNYLVIQRNFDPVTFQPSRYVNGSRFTYQVAEFELPIQFADAIEPAPVDPLHAIHGYSAVAAVAGGLEDVGLTPGVFYTYLTRDDIGGLRYLYNTNNLNWEGFPDDTQIFAPDLNGFTTVSNLDLTLLSVQSLTTPPHQLTNLYPGLIIGSVVTNLTDQIRIEPVSTQVFVNLVTNRGDLQIVTNYDLYAFSQFTLTNPPSVVTNSAQYPGLEILGYTQSITQRQDIVSIVLTNGPRYPWGDPFATNLIFVTNYVNNLGILYHYTFGNVVTNVYSPTTVLRREIFGLEREPWGDPLFPTFKTNIIETEIGLPSGNIFILSSNVLRYEFSQFQPATNIVLITNYFTETNFVVNGFLRTIRDAEFRLSTNIQYPVYPITALTQGFFTNIVVGTVTNRVNIYDYTFLNVLTNYASTPPHTTVPLTIHQINPDGTTNTIVTTTNVITGGFLIDTNQTGFQFTGFETRSFVPVTIVLSDTLSPNGGRVQQIISYVFTNTAYGILPFTLQDPPPLLLRPGVDQLTFVRLGTGTLPGQSLGFTNSFQASYWTNGTLRTSTFRRASTVPDILFTAADLGTMANSVYPVQSRRSENFVSFANENNIPDDEAGGPGIIEPTVVITFNNIGPSLINSYPGFTTEESVINFINHPFVWGSFDGSSRPPIVFPQDISLEQIEAIILGTGNP